MRPIFAEIKADPASNPVTTPVVDTLAVVGSEENHCALFVTS